MAKVLGRKRNIVHNQYRRLIPKDYDWSKHQDEKSFIELIAELKFNNRLREKLNHFGISVTYFARKFDVAKSFWSIFNAAPHWVNIQHWIDGKFELGHIIPQSIFVPTNIIHGNMANNPTNFFIQLKKEICLRCKCSLFSLLS